MDDYRDREVYLVRDITNRGGEAFKRGERMVCTGHHRGKLTLRRKEDLGQHNRPSLRQILRCDVSLEPVDAT